MNSYWILWIGCLRRARSELARWTVSAIFKKWPFVIKPYFLLFEARISCVFLILLLRSIKAYLYPNIINFDCVDFSEHCPEEVISFFWRSVYIDVDMGYLQPQDSLGEFKKKILLDLQKVQEIIKKHHQTFLQLFGMTYCNAILPNGKLSLCT